MNKIYLQPQLLAVLAISFFAPTQNATAQAISDGIIEEIVATGTRAPGRSAADLPVPVDSIQ